MVLTVKYGKGYEAPWAVFHGQPNEVREDIATWFGIEPSAVVELTGSELAINVSQLAQGKGNAASVLGAVVINSAPGVQVAAPASGVDVWAGLDNGTVTAGTEEWPLDSEERDHPFATVINEIAKAGDTKELQRVWAANQPAFKDETVMTAYKARGKELTK